ncbi:peroxiredoxin [Marinobacterium sediminicola]|uniref:Glutathione-dependent peroxiredoxin n=1 Tax=Marinobacterium sediminicola TaxID=518898 RepID=A0ABY1S1H8_9GAMM|nr:peroxiredoxin [Marinobacterium sediminicola]ULG69393.1 peroxiredoxin [Marinobacterium sediminicola]SMR75541.1 Peroxiredoxin [Marinobacterium sediminicola]
MSIQIGDRIPNVELRVMGAEGPEAVHTADLFAGKKVVLFAVPGAFTPGCSMTHLPGFVVKADEIKAKGVDTIICTSVNDVFVMDAWGKAQNAEAITMLADGIGEFASAMGLDQDLSGVQFGKRSQRYAMIVNDGVVELLNVDQKGIDKSSADTILAAL